MLFHRERDERKEEKGLREEKRLIGAKRGIERIGAGMKMTLIEGWNGWINGKTRQNCACYI